MNLPDSTSMTYVLYEAVLQPLDLETPRMNNISFPLSPLTADSYIVSFQGSSAFSNYRIASTPESCSTAAKSALSESRLTHPTTMFMLTLVLVPWNSR
jgi:hypothetical protein